MMQRAGEAGLRTTGPGGEEARPWRLGASRGTWGAGGRRLRTQGLSSRGRGHGGAWLLVEDGGRRCSCSAVAGMGTRRWISGAVVAARAVRSNE